MRQGDFDNSAPLDMQDELKRLIGHLRDALDRLIRYPQDSHAPIKALESTKLFLFLLESARLNVLIPLIQALERYLKAIQSGMVIEVSQLDILSVIGVKLVQLADVKVKEWGKYFQEHAMAFDLWIAQLTDAVHRYEKKKLPALSTEEILEKKNAIEVDLHLVELFFNGLKDSINVFNRSLVALNLDPHSSLHFVELLQAAGVIKQTGCIIQLAPIAEMGNALENYVLALKEGRIAWSQGGGALLSKIVNLFSDMVHLTPNKLNCFIQERSYDFKEITQELTSLSTIQAGGEVEAGLKEQEAIKEKLGGEVQEIVLDPMIFDLFRIELETQCAILNQGLIELEQRRDPSLLEVLMRAAHSIKGAARVVSLSSIVRLAHAMEDCFVAAQNQKFELDNEKVDCLLQVVDLLSHLSKLNQTALNGWIKEQGPLVEKLIQQLSHFIYLTGSSLDLSQKKIMQKEEVRNAPKIASAAKLSLKEAPKKPETMKAFQATFSRDRVLRVTAQNLNRLMGLAGESLVESRWLYPFAESLQKLKSEHNGLADCLDVLRENLREVNLSVTVQNCLTSIQYAINEARHQLTERLGELDSFIRRHASLSDRLYQEVINSRMRPFADGVEAFPRMIRDLARQLGKRVKLEIEGKATPVDRDILEKLESPLGHLLRNAVDHGIESPRERQDAGKSPEGRIKLEAHHRGGILAIVIMDDGRGLDIERLREKIVEKKFVSAEMANRLEDSEILDFLFLPGFSTAKEVTEVSGRGMGLNIVKSIVQEVGGIVKTEFKTGKGTSFHLQLPLTLSVIRALLVEISGEVYAFPLARINQAFLIDQEEIEMIENRQYFRYEDQNIGLISAWQILELEAPQLKINLLPIIVLSDRLNSYGLVVDRLIGERELVVQELDPRLGRVPDIIAGALMENGHPVLIIDVDDIVHSIDLFLSRGRLTQLSYSKEQPIAQERKRILVVDDSLTVREVECRLLQNQGYEVETAVDGIDGWNAVRVGHYDLIITDVDMPRMNGIELVQAIKNDPQLKGIAIMIVSYKEREEDRIKGLEAGADYYLTKSSFHDATLLEAVNDLIGKAISH